MNRQKEAYIFASFAVILWATVATAFKLTLAHINSVQMLLVSSFVATITSFILLIFTKDFNLSKIQVDRNTISQLFHSIFLGFINPFLYYLILFRAYELLPAQIVQPLNFLWPILIVLLSIPLLKQKLKLRHFLALFISFFGVIIISTQGSFSFDDVNKFGIALALISTVLWAFFFILNIRDHRNEHVKLFLSFGFGTIFTFIYFLITKQEFNFSIPAIIGSIYIGLAEMAITFAIWIKALKLSRTTAQVNNFIYLTPFLSLLIIGFVLKETILLSTIIGLVLIISGILLQEK